MCQFVISFKGNHRDYSIDFNNCFELKKIYFFPKNKAMVGESTYLSKSTWKRVTLKNDIITTVTGYKS